MVRRTAGTSAGAVLLAICLTACSDLIVRPPEENLNRVDFEAVWSTVNDYYPCLEFKGIDWDAVHATYLPRVEEARGDEFYRVLHDLLGELRDGHVRYFTPGGSERYPWIPPRRRRDQDLYNPFVVRGYFTRDLALSPSGKIEYGILSGDVKNHYITHKIRAAPGSPPCLPGNVKPPY